MEKPLPASGHLWLSLWRIVITILWCSRHIALSRVPPVSAEPCLFATQARQELRWMKQREREKQGRGRRNGIRYTRVLIWGYVAQGRWIMLKYISKSTQTFFKSILSLVSHILWPYWKTIYFWQDLHQEWKGKGERNGQLQTSTDSSSKCIFIHLCHSSGGEIDEYE